MLWRVCRSVKAADFRRRLVFFLNDTATTEIYALSLHDALPISPQPMPRTGPVVAPIIVEKPTLPAPYVLRRVTAICGTGDATISVASFGGTVRLKKI